MGIKNKSNKKNRKRPLIVTTIAAIDILLGIVMISMMVTIVNAWHNFYNNPDLASKVLITFGTSYSSMIYFALKVFVLMISTLIFAFGLLKNKNWAILGRIFLSLILIVYYLYGYFVGEAIPGNILIYYDLFVIAGLGWIQFK